MNGPVVTVRRGQASDTDIVTDFNYSMCLETEHKELPRDTLRAGVSRVLTDETKGRYYVLEEDGVVAAQLMITLEWSDWRNSDCWWIQSVYVRPESRRRGHFRSLYNHARKEAIAAGACGLRLYADDTNVRAHATYRSLGMTSHYRVFEDMFTHY